MLPETLKIHILTLSDRASQGEYEDLSGPRAELKIKDYYEKTNCSVLISREIIADEASKLNEVLQACLANGTDALITTGGTGIGPRDITVDTLKPQIEKEIPGIMELIRVKYGQNKPNALLSRSIAGTIGQCQIYTLPGSRRGVEEYLDEILKTLGHLYFMMRGIDVH
ncbi:MAG: hypothetical protein RIS47_716 [Bacteroidota bacterium]|jgi:molybdenum cofactor synthesis domain-containing protein